LKSARFSQIQPHSDIYLLLASVQEISDWDTILKHSIGIELSEREWKSWFGLCMEDLELIWIKYGRCHLLKKPKYLLWIFHFLRNYLVEDVGHKMWHVPKQTYRDHVWETID
jgi:hypothetical protein